MSADETGTDSGRANVFTTFSTPQIITALREGCTELAECYMQPGNIPFPDSEILTVTEKYTPLPLNGIWAAAPYLHNGSVPTLYHLITGKRPSKFFRGNTSCDQNFVGFTWTSDTSGRAFEYDTSLIGFSNEGHQGDEFNGGINWDENPRMLWDLIEYLKTL